LFIRWHPLKRGESNNIITLITMVQTLTFIQNSLGEIVDKAKYESWCINEITAKYVQSMRMKILKEGKNSACRHYKGLHLVAQCIATNRTLPVIPYCKTTRDGVPRELIQVKQLLQSGDADLQRFGLTITRNYEQIYTKVVWNPNPITDRGPKISEQLKLEFNNFCYNWTNKLGIRNRNLQSSTTIRSGIVKGPNGPAIVTAHQDAGAVLDDIELSTNLKTLATLTGNKWIWEMLQFLGQPEQNKGFKSGRISLLQEGGGKTRTIAIADYWSQNLLRPIHKVLMDILKRLETDGTFSHGDQFKRIILKSKGNITYCHDLSSATDRFPVELQEILLSHVFSKELADCWRKVLTSRSFSYRNTHVKWETGQPLGLLSSWAAFALTHHAIIEFCAFQKGFKSFKKYAVLGDDVAIWEEDVAKQYEQLLTEIGVPINYDKSLVSDTRTHRLEFAKRIAVNGVEISGLKPAILKSSDTLSGYLDLIRTARDRSWNLHWADVLGPSSWSVNRKDLLSILVWEASDGTCAPKGLIIPEGNTEVTKDSIFNDLKEEILSVRRDSILQKVEQLDRLLAGKPVEELFQKGGITVSERSIGLLGATSVYHPVVWEINRVGESLNRVLIKLWEEPGPDGLPPMSDVEFLPIPNLGVYFGEKHLLRSKAHSSLVLRAWSSLNNHEVD